MHNLPFIVIEFQGMKYLHNTAVKFHGNLTSTRCVIDSHWVVKITDWGLHEFKAGQEKNKKPPNKMYAGAFSSYAPFCTVLIERHRALFN